jgi:hypothetical protein
VLVTLPCNPIHTLLPREFLATPCTEISCGGGVRVDAKSSASLWYSREENSRFVPFRIEGDFTLFSYKCK